MSLVCAQCSRVNPADAAYCFYDGAALAGRAGGPINAGSAPFPNPFVFPKGQSCRNFDQLASACQQNWSAAIDLLKQGYLGSFFGALGVDRQIDAPDAAEQGAEPALLQKIACRGPVPLARRGELIEVSTGLPFRTGERIRKRR